MTARSSYWNRRIAVLALVALAAGRAPVAAQSEAESLCAGTAALLECNLAATTAALIQPRVGLALWGGSPTPGTASTLGFRIGRTPRIGISARVAGVPTALAPLLDRSVNTGATGLVSALSIQSSVALVQGLSPVPTVGGVVSVDLLGRVSAAHVPVGKGFDRGTVWGWAAGLRVGLLRESFTLPGVSLTATYGHSTSFTFGDPSGTATDGFVRGSVSGLGVTAAASRWLLGMRFTGGLSWDRYGSALEAHYAGAPSAGPGSVVEGRLGMTRWSGFGSVTWTRLVYHTTLEVGWQEPPTQPTLPLEVDVTPMTWWAGLAFRVTP